MKRSKWIKISLYTLLACIVIAAAGAGVAWYKLENTISAMYEPLPSTEWTQPVFERENLQEDIPATLPSNPVEEEGAANDVAVGDQAVSTANATNDDMKLTEDEVDRLLHPNLDRKDPFCILLLGVDERPSDRGRSDTMILLSIQPAKHSAMAISIPRDTRVLIPQRERYDKINHAYAFGGTALSVAAVERLFGVPIAYYMKTNMEGIVDIVDTVGGVDVDNARSFTYEGVTFPKGEQHLDGTNALLYVRMRKEDPNGDFGRTERQRQLLSALVDRVVSFRSLGKLPHILSRLSEDVRTNLTSGDMFDLATEYKSEIKQIDTLFLNGKGRMIDGIYYYAVQPEDRAALHDRLLKHLRGA